VPYTGERVGMRPNEKHIGSGKTQKGWKLGEGKGTWEQWGTKGTVYEQPGTEVDHSCHSWRVPSK
jgi:hypothetical protein